MIIVKADGSRNVEGHDNVRAAVERAQASLAGRGRVLLRASGTEPVIRVMVEGEDSDLVNLLAAEVAQAVVEAAR